MQKQETQMSARELRTRVDGVVPPLLSSIAQMADAVRNTSDDLDVKRRALLLELDAVPVVYRAAYQRDPLAAALDLWLFVYQLEGCVEAARGPCDFGTERAMATVAARKLRSDLEEEYRRVAPNPAGFERSQSLIEQLAVVHPIAGEGSIVRRYALTTELAQTLGTESKDAFSVVGDVEASVEDLSYRLNTYVGDVPTLVRWQVALALDDTLRRPEVTGSLSDARRLIDASVKALDPKTLDALLDSTFARFQRERGLVLEEVDRQRSLSLEYLGAERKAVLDAIERERQQVLEQLRRERIETLKEAERMIHEALRQGTESAFDVIDHLMWRVGLLLAAIASLGALLSRLLLKALRAWQQPDLPANRRTPAE